MYKEANALTNFGDVHLLYIESQEIRATSSTCVYQGSSDREIQSSVGFQRRSSICHTNSGEKYFKKVGTEHGSRKSHEIVLLV